MDDLPQKPKLVLHPPGLTLIELLVVMVVLSVLALIVVPQFVSRTQKSREANLRSNLQLLRNALREHNAEGHATVDLQHLCEVHTGGGVHGPYLNELPQDPTQLSNSGRNANWNFNSTLNHENVHSRTAAYANW